MVIVGSVLSTLGDAVSTSYVTGVKMAVSDFYNDQIREIYASKSEMVELKEVSALWRLGLLECLFHYNRLMIVWC